MGTVGKGQRIFKVFTLVNPTLGTGFPQCEDNKYDCQYCQPVITDGTSDEFKTDKSPLLIMSALWTTGVQFRLQQLDEVAQTWADVTTFSDAYGEFYDMGYWPAKPNYSGFVIYWDLVYASFGVGQFRMKITEINPAYPSGQETFTRPWCLRLWNCHIHNSVRLEWWLNKGIGDIDNDKNILDFSDINWYSQMRIDNSIFGYPVSTYEEDQIQYSNGEIQNVADNQEEKYKLVLMSVPAWVHNIVKTYALQSDKLLITDYGKNNPQELVKKQVRRTSSYEPKWSPGNKCAPVTVEFKPAFNRLERYRCL